MAADFMTSVSTVNQAFWDVLGCIVLKSEYCPRLFSDIDTTDAEIDQFLVNVRHTLFVQYSTAPVGNAIHELCLKTRALKK